MPVIIDGTSGITTPSIDTTTPLITADGGTGTGTLTAGSVLVGNGTSAVNLVAAGSSGNVLTSNGTTWTSAAAGGGQFQTQLFTSPGTWTKPASCTQVIVTCVGGGGGGSSNPVNGSTLGGDGGIVVATGPVTGPVSVTVGAGGASPGVSGQPGVTGGTSSFGPLASATGGAGATAFSPVANGAPGTGSTIGTALRNLGPARLVSTLFTSTTDRSPSAGGPGIAFSPSSAVGAGNRGLGMTGAYGGVGGVVLVEFVG